MKVTKIPKFRRFVLQNFPFIEQDFDALTDYALICKVVEYLNKVISQTNTNTEQVAELSEAFNLLQQYVEDYFENLDVQEEINIKLDQMVEDGTLDTILQRVLGLYDEYHFHTLMATRYYRSSEDEFGMQGGCVLPNNTIFQITLKNSYATPKILIYAEDGTLLNSKSVDYGHCNGVTYNSKTGNVMITSTQSDDLGRYMVYEVNPTTLDEVARYNCEDKEFPSTPYGLVYVEEEDCYIFCNYWREGDEKYLWKTDSEFNLLDSKVIDVEVRSTSNIGRFGNYIGVNTISDRNVMLFNFNLNFFKQVKINQVVSDTWCITEVEWFDTRNGKVYLGFVPAAATSPTMWGYGTKVFAVFDPAINYNEIRKSNTEFAPSGEYYYVDDTQAYNPIRDGSSTAPFENINEALNSAMRTDNITGCVTIVIRGNTQNTFYPFFAMNKSYKVILAGEETEHKTFSGMYVAQCANVVISKRVNLTANGTLYRDASIVNEGKLYIDGDLVMSDNSKIVIAGVNGSEMTCRFAGGGYDLSAFYGKLININTAYASSNSFLTTRALTPSTQITTKVIGYRETLTETDTNKYQVPCLSPTVNLTIRFNLPNGSAGTTTTFEGNYTYVSGCYTGYGVTFLDTDDTVKYMRIVVNDSGALQFTNTPTGGITNVRVKACTSE